MVSSVRSAITGGGAGVSRRAKVPARCPWSLQARRTSPVHGWTRLRWRLMRWRQPSSPKSNPPEDALSGDGVRSRPSPYHGDARRASHFRLIPAGAVVGASHGLGRQQYLLGGRFGWAGASPPSICRACSLYASEAEPLAGESFAPDVVAGLDHFVEVFGNRAEARTGYGAHGR